MKTFYLPLMFLKQTTSSRHNGYNLRKKGNYKNRSKKTTPVAQGFGVVFILINRVVAGFVLLVLLLPSQT